MFGRSCRSIMSFGFLFILLSCFASKRSHACTQHDHDGLLSFFLNISSSSSSSSPPPPSNLNWSDTDCCLWEGITCDQDSRVTHLWLPSRGLTGSLSPSLGNLSRLSHINLSHNSLFSPLPDQFFSSLDHLEVLDLSSNLLSGELQSSLSFSIQAIDLSSNKFDGMIRPSFLRLASNLIYFNISQNSFDGPFPSFICTNSPFIKLLDISFNKFTGQIPHGFGQCSKLEVLRAGFNSLSGFLPYDIFNAMALSEISLPANKLSGHIGDDIVHLSDLTILELYSNELIGELPKDIGKLSILEQLSLQFNNLTGSLPPSLMNCTNLMTLNLWNNFMKGDLSALNFSKFQQLRVLDLGVNTFSGEFPKSLYSCKSLAALRLAGNQLKGQISSGMLALQSLSFLSLAANGLVNVTGTLEILMGCRSLRTAILTENFINEVMPSRNSVTDVPGFKNLEFLGLCGCQLTGQVPAWLAKLKNLVGLDLSINQLTGSIPGFLGTLPNLFYIDLSNNHFTGEFPTGICQLPVLTSEKAAAKINRTYLLLPIYNRPTSASVLQYRRVAYLPPAIKLGNNNLSGHIPVEIGQLQLLHVLDLNQNNFSGNIPGQISDLANLEKLDLSRNHFSGEIPESLQRLHFLSQFNVAYNNLRGQIPSGSQSQLDLFGSSSYIGNPELCGLPLPNACQISNGSNANDIQEEDDDEHKIPWFDAVVGLGFFTGFWVVCATLCLKNSWRHAYFDFLNDINNRVFVHNGAKLARLWRGLRS